MASLGFHELIDDAREVHRPTFAQSQYLLIGSAASVMKGMTMFVTPIRESEKLKKKFVASTALTRLSVGVGNVLLPAVQPGNCEMPDAEPEGYGATDHLADIAGR